MLDYASQLKESVVTLWDKAKANLERAQIRQKNVYDKNTKPRQLAVGDLVLILLPSSDNKLLAKWQGPFQVLEQITQSRIRWRSRRKGDRNRFTT